MNGVGELHSTTLEVTMDSFFSGVQLHFTIDRYKKEVRKNRFTRVRVFRVLSHLILQAAIVDTSVKFLLLFPGICTILKDTYAGVMEW